MKKEGSSALHHALAEREKELDALYKLAALFSRPVMELESLFEETGEILCGSMQFPARTSVDICGDGISRRYGARGTVVDSFQARASYATDKPVTLTVSYRYKTGAEPGRTAIDDREKHLIESTAAFLAEVLERREMDRVLRESARTLERQTGELERKNIALREVLSQIEQEKRAALHGARTYVEVFIQPYLHQLSGGDQLDPQDRERVRQIEAALGRLFTTADKTTIELTDRLSPREAQICGLIRNGMTSKEIASFLHISQATVERHRNTIRRKLELTGKSVNLTSYLRTLP